MTFLYGHLWVVLSWVAIHPTCGVIALPLLALRNVRAGSIAAEIDRFRYYKWNFQTKSQLVITTVEWLLQWLGHTSLPIWLAWAR